MLADRIRTPRKNVHGGLEKPFLIAEAGVNHENDMDLARRMINEASEAGADAIKFQTYKADTLAAKDSPAYWDQTQEPTSSQHALFKKHDRFWKREYEELAKHCQAAGIEFLSTPFDTESADFLSDLMGAIKVASADITNKPFLEYLANKGKPLLLSTGASQLGEVGAALSWVKNAAVPVSLMHCVLNYPTKDADANLGRIRGLAEAFPELVVGYSDHTLPKDMKTLEIAWLLGAHILEKHFTFDKSLKGNDHYHAMDRDDLAKLNDRIERTVSLYGTASLDWLEIETTARRNARRSLVAAVQIPKGEIITAELLTPKRPGTGISPSEIDSVIGKRAFVSIHEDSILQWSMIE